MRKSVKSWIGKFVPKRIKSVLRRYVLPDPYRGKKVQCTICGAEYAMFAPYGATKRKNARCLNCGSAERHRLIWKYLHERTDFLSRNENIRLLHFAPEKCFFDKFSTMSNVEYFPCDLFPDSFWYNTGGLIQQADITSIPFPDDTFDVIFCNHVLEHIPDDKKAMQELFRVMKRGGWGIFQVPIDYDRESTYEDFSITSPEERTKAFGQHDHVRWYGQDYKKRLERAGFNVNEDDFVRKFSPSEIAKFRFTSTELIYHCSKL